jgi:hypothetical protein
VLDRRLELLAARLELHTANLAAVQRDDIARIDDRLALDVAVVSEHLVAMERLTRRGSGLALGNASRVLVALPGEPLTMPDGARLVACYAPGDDGTWHAVTDAGPMTLRIAAPATPPA